ncbi:Variant surface glycoprotein [Trypanosoma congolense IL3000]|uniref:Variant surface glycoprotein n=1 Tax=Trypanosoma congolense (strain IL3000) TaxID=1068625 RepID=F9W5W7_TRYCI|nr:Variant surface glycoprotein [Trypanosoma congolense IL3000]
MTRMMMKFWMMMIVTMGVSTNVEGTDHNHDAHNALCDLLSVSVKKWGEVKERKHDDPLRNALKQTIFGYGSVGEDLDKLKTKFPKDYEGVEGRLSSRSNWCGQPHEWDGYFKDEDRWSGHSAPHDMVCLCTVGEKGWPLNESKSYSDAETTLCGQDKQTLGATDGKGWDDDRKEKPGENHVNATWFGVTVSCLKGETGGDLKKALKNFLGKLEHNPGHGYDNRYRLGKGNVSSYAACNGKPELGVCAMYYNTTKPLPWWTELERALIEDEQIQKQREEEERRKQQGETEKQDLPKTAAITSGPSTTNQTEGTHKNTLHEAIRKLNMTSGTTISQPSSWLLSALLLI